MNTMTKSEVERITALEVQMAHLTEIVEKQNEKLDDLTPRSTGTIGLSFVMS